MSLDRNMPGELPWEGAGTADDAEMAEHPTHVTGPQESLLEDKDGNPWQIVLEIGKEHDKDLIDNWKDELNNLLIFAGLFSAVVTAFTVESYQWLQQDPADTSVVLLTQISQQLSSFTVTSGFINSTAPTAAVPSFQPSSSATNINVLWILSLTLSLVSAFYAITVQQWIRQVTAVPRYLHPRDAVRLRQWRYECLMAWQVPSIITFLPLLIQVAVVLFLAGLLLLLSSLNDIVTAAFAVVAGLCLILFAVTVICPLLSIRCPYKSPIIPTLLAVLQWCAAPAIGLVVIMFSGIGVFFILLSLAIDPFAFFSRRNWISRVIVPPLHVLWEALFDRLLGLIRPTTVGLQRFWTNIETEEVSQQWNVEVPALSWAIATTTGRHSLFLHDVFRTLSISQKTQCALLAVANSIGFHTTDGSLRDNIKELKRFQRLLYLPAHSFVSLRRDHVDLMMEAMSSDWAATSWASADGNISPLLLLMYLAMRSEKLSPSSLFRVLVHARSHQELNVTDPLSFLNQRVPTLLICSQMYAPRYINLTREDAHAMTTWALEDLYRSRWVPVSTFVPSPEVIRAVEFILAASATAITAVAAYPDVLSTNRPRIENLLSACSEFAERHKDSLVALVKLSERKREEHLLLSTPLAVNMICESLANLAVAQVLPLSAGCASVVLVGHLRDVLRHAREPAYGVAHTDLGRFEDAILGAAALREQGNIRETAESQPSESERSWGQELHMAGALRSLVPCYFLTPMHDHPLG